MVPEDDWQHSKALARAILRDRVQRRKWLARWLLLTMIWMVLGLWVLDGWLADEAWRFLLWWFACAVLAGILMIFAVYDALSVIREEREKAANPDPYE